MKTLPQWIQNILDINPLPCFIYDPKSLLINNFNKAGLECFGFNKKNSELKLQSLFPENQTNKFLSNVKNKLKEDNLFTIGVFKVLTLDNKKEFELSGQVITNSENKFIIIFCNDIHKKVTKINSISSTKKGVTTNELNEYIGSTEIGYWRFDLKNNNYYWTENVYNIWNIKKNKSTISPEDLASRIHPEDLPSVKKTYEKALQKFNNYDIKYRIKLPDGSLKWIHEMGSFVKNDKHQTIIGITVDIGQYSEKNQSLQLLKNIVTHANDMVLITKAENKNNQGLKVVYANNAFTKITGYKAEEIIGKTPRILQGPNSDRKELNKLKKALENYEPCEITTINYKKNKKQFWANFTVSPILNDLGVYTHFIAIEKDITKQKQYEQEIEIKTKISNCFSIDKNFKKATNRLCKLLCAFGEFDFAELWLPSFKEKKLNLIAKHAASGQGKEFYKLSKSQKSFKISEGLPGHVFKQKNILYWENLGSNTKFIRRESSHQSNINTGIGIPLINKQNVIGVLVLGTKKSKNDYEIHKKTLNSLKRFLGSELKRKIFERDLTRLHDTVPQLICTTDLEGNFLNMNKAGLAMIGFKEKEVINKSFKDFIYPKDIDNTHKILEKVKSKGKISSFENRYITKNGNLIWLSWTSKLNKEEGFVYAAAKNITEEKNLRELNKMASELAKIGSWEINYKKNTVFWSEYVYEIHELDPKFFTPNEKNIFSFLRDDYKSVLEAKIYDCKHKASAFDEEVVIVAANKKEYWVRIIGKPEQINDVCVRIYGSIQFIDERKDSEIRMNQWSKNLPGVIFQYHLKPDGTDNLRYVSVGAKEIWGFTYKEAMEKNELVWNQIKKGGDFEKVQATIEQSINKKSKWTCTFRYQMPDGSIKHHVGYGSPSFLANGSVVFNSVILDRTQEFENEKELEQTAKLAKVGSWSVDLVKNKIYWSKLVHKLHGTDPKSYNPNVDSAISFYREDYRSLVEKQINECIITGKQVTFDAILVTTTNKERWVRAICNAEYKDGECVRFFGSFQDVTELKEIEIRLDSITKNLPGVVYQYVLNPSKKDEIRYITKRSKEIWGYESSEVIDNVNLVWKGIKASGDLDILQESITKSIDNKTNWTCKFKYLHPNGALRTLLGYGAPTFQADGTILFNSIVLDVTRETQLESLIKQTSELAKIGSWEYKIDHNENELLFCSLMTFDILEIDTNNDISATDVKVFFNPKDWKNLMKLTSELIVKKQPIDKEFSIITKKGVKKWIRLFANTEVVSNRTTKLFGSIQDITNSKSLEVKNKEILESISDAFFALNENWEFTYFNKKSESLIKQKASKVLNKSIWDILPNSKDSILEEKLMLAFTKDTKVTFEYNFGNNKDYYEVIVYPSSDGLSVYFRDIKERKQAELEILNANQEKQDILDSIGDAFFTVNKNWLITFWNMAAQKLLEKDYTDVINQSLWLVFSDKNLIKLRDRFKEIKNKEKYVNFEFYLENKNKWLDISVFKAKTGISIYLKDITSKINYVNELNRANERFEKMTQATNDVVWDWDIVNDYFYRSQSVQNYFHKSRNKEITSREFWQDAFHPDDIVDVKESVRIAIENKNQDKWEKEYRIIDLNNNVKHIVDRGLIVRDKEGKALRMVGAMIDITEIKDQQKELNQLNEHLTKQKKELESRNQQLMQFAFISSHDLQEPLRMISSFLELLKKRYADKLDTRGLGYINYAIDGSRRMKNIIVDLLEYSKADNLSNLRLEKIDLNEIIDNYKILRANIIERYNAQIKSPKFPIIISYKVPLTQVIHSIIDNAIKYSKKNEQPRVSLQLKESKENWTISISDNGIGIDEKFWDKVFQIFQRLHKRDDYEGTGIGLAVAKKHVESIGGEIWLESKLGIGTTFFFTIPKHKIEKEKAMVSNK